MTVIINLFQKIILGRDLLLERTSVSWVLVTV